MRYPVSSPTTKPANVMPVSRSRPTGSTAEVSNRKWLKPAAKVLIPIFILWLLVTARPGDVLFTPKLIFNKAFTPAITIFGDRIASYKSLAGASSCAQLVLAENEVIDTLDKLKPSDSTQAKETYKIIAENTQDLSTIKSGCKLNPAIIAIPDLYWLLANTDSLGGISISQGIYKPKLVKYDEQYKALKGKLAAATNLEPAAVTKANSLLLDINNTIFSLDKLGKDIDDLKTATTLIGVSKNLIYAEQIISKQESNYFPWQGDVILLCSVFKDKAGCDSIRLNAALNSIRISQQPTQIATQGLKLFAQYYEQATHGTV